MVFEAMYLVAVLTAGHMSLCCGQNGAQMSKVLRPINKSNGMFICFLMAVERTGSECGLIHPPYAKPPLVSSSGPPGACMTHSIPCGAESANLKLVRAQEHILAIRDINEDYTEREPNVIIKHPDGSNIASKWHYLAHR